MTDLELFRQFFLARLHTSRLQTETAEEFAERCRDEALAAWDTYEDCLELFDQYTGKWTP